MAEKITSKHVFQICDERIDDIIAAIRDDDPIGICVLCGDDSMADHDARYAECAGCGERSVFGSHILIMYADAMGV